MLDFSAQNPWLQICFGQEKPAAPAAEQEGGSSSNLVRRSGSKSKCMVSVVFYESSSFHVVVLLVVSNLCFDCLIVLYIVFDVVVFLSRFV